MKPRNTASSLCRRWYSSKRRYHTYTKVFSYLLYRKKHLNKNHQMFCQKKFTNLELHKKIDRSLKDLTLLHIICFYKILDYKIKFISIPQAIWWTRINCSDGCCIRRSTQRYRKWRTRWWTSWLRLRRTWQSCFVSDRFVFLPPFNILPLLPVR